MNNMTDPADLQADIVSSIVQSLEGASWRSFEYEFRQAATVGEHGGSFIDENGNKEPFAEESGACSLAFSKLRKVMATPTHGTWYSAAVRAVRDGNVTFSFNYTERPAWQLEIGDELYAADAERFPRPVSEMPAWHPATKRK